MRHGGDLGDIEPDGYYIVEIIDGPRRGWRYNVPYAIDAASRQVSPPESIVVEGVVYRPTGALSDDRDAACYAVVSPVADGRKPAK